MSAIPRNAPPYRADHVGSLLRPRHLFEARQKWHEGTLDDSALKAIEDECIREAILMQEDVGLKGITDGDFRRDDWFLDFMFSLDGMERVEGGPDVPFSGGLVFRAPVLKLTGRVGCPEGGIMVDDFAFVNSATERTAKIAIPAPAMFYTIVNSETVDRAIYPDPNEFWDDLGAAYEKAVAHLADAGCHYIQIDDCNSANIADPKWQEFWRHLGYEPEELVDSFIDINNAAVQNRPAHMTAAVHMCRGNYQSQWAGEGGYDMVADRFFNHSKVDAFFLEYDDERSGDFDPLRYMPKDKVAVLGIMTSKRPELESKDELKRRIDAATKYVPLENLCISPQCGFASTQEGNRLTITEQRRKLARLVEVAEEVWGAI
ncbi:MAG TPA: 5-methyltetrahydropteroyltriglutamate--homocysteine S-methyltransferase [Alphaproteobacteria bacterium]|nr:5-methyltetrahydropteroyltriglutamate--homocysteine S-methyltransferase [Alphaproteobacteria bacterium]